MSQLSGVVTFGPDGRNVNKATLAKIKEAKKADKTPAMGGFGGRIAWAAPEIPDQVLALPVKAGVKGEVIGTVGEVLKAGAETLAARYGQLLQLKAHPEWAKAGRKTAKAAPDLSKVAAF